MSLIEPVIQKEAIDEALAGKLCPRHNMAPQARIEKRKLVLHYCCKEFSEELAPFIKEVNARLFERFKRKD